MTDDPDERPMAEGHKYDAPESPEETRSKAVLYVVLAVVVFAILFLISTGRVQIL